MCEKSILGSTCINMYQRSWYCAKRFGIEKRFLSPWFLTPETSLIFEPRLFQQIQYLQNDFWWTCWTKRSTYSTVRHFFWKKRPERNPLCSGFVFSGSCFAPKPNRHFYVTDSIRSDDTLYIICIVWFHLSVPDRIHRWYHLEHLNQSLAIKLRESIKLARNVRKRTISIAHWERNSPIKLQRFSKCERCRQMSSNKRGWAYWIGRTYLRRGQQILHCFFRTSREKNNKKLRFWEMLRRSVDTRGGFRECCSSDSGGGSTGIQLHNLCLWPDRYLR